MSKKKKIIIIAVAVTLALVLGVGGLAQAIMLPDHTETGGHKLIGVGELGEDDQGFLSGFQWWDTQFIITNPNCDKDLTIEWVALIAGGEDVDWDGPWLDAEEVIFEGTPEDWYDYTYENTEGPVIEIPGNEESEIGVLSPHEVWQVSIAELIAAYEDEGLWEAVDKCDLSKYTLEVTWSGVSYSLWWGWRGRPLIGWQKEKCWSQFEWWVEGIEGEYLVDFAISEAEMQLFPGRTPFRLPELPLP